MSEPSRPPVSLDVVRVAVERALELRSLRQVAREVGLSTRGLRLFLDGNSSQKRTAHMLLEWYARHGAQVVGMSSDTAAVSLSNLLDGVEEADRDHAEMVILGYVEMLHRRRNKLPPSWIEDLLHRTQ